MPEAPSSKEVARGILKLHPSKARQGKEQNWFLEVDGVMSGRVTVPKGKKFLPPGTWKSICKQAGVPDPLLREIAGCSKGYKEYANWIRASWGSASDIENGDWVELIGDYDGSPAGLQGRVSAVHREQGNAEVAWTGRAPRRQTVPLPLLRKIEPPQS